MLIRYPDRTHQWACDRCGFKAQRRVTLKASAQPNPPWGWCGTDAAAFCDRCTKTVEATAAEVGT